MEETSVNVDVVSPEKLTTLKLRLKKWEREFLKVHGRKATKVRRRHSLLVSLWELSPPHTHTYTHTPSLVLLMLQLAVYSAWHLSTYLIVDYSSEAGAVTNLPVLVLGEYWLILVFFLPRLT